MKSGTNSLHGSAYGVFRTSFLNAGQPFTNAGGHPPAWPEQAPSEMTTALLWVARSTFRNCIAAATGPSSFGAGSSSCRDRTSCQAHFFRADFGVSPGDFSAAITAAGNKSNLGTDPLGRPILADMIYDPTTRSVAPGGQIVTNPFGGNMIPKSYWDPVALKIQESDPTRPSASRARPATPMVS